MHDEPVRTSPNAPKASNLRSHPWGAGLLLVTVLLFSSFLWSSREPHAVQPLDVVTLRPPLQATSDEIEIVPYQHRIEPLAPRCPTIVPGTVCLIIGAGPATPPAMTFT